MTNIGRYPKPDLVDPILEQKVIKTLKPVKPDYWMPTKNVAKSFYQDYIRPNILFIIIFICICLFLLYRYRVVRKEKVGTVIQSKPVSAQLEAYANLVIDAYNQQKENLREPVMPSPRPIPKQTETTFAYPVYPYSEGTLEPGGKR